MNAKLEEAYKKEFGIKDTHKLVLTERKVKNSKGRDNEDFYFDELNENGEIVGKYHAWSYQDTNPPLKANTGSRKLI